MSYLQQTELGGGGGGAVGVQAGSHLHQLSVVG